MPSRALPYKYIEILSYVFEEIKNKRINMTKITLTGLKDVALYYTDSIIYTIERIQKP